MLTGRTQNTRVGNSLSESVLFGSGVVQGSWLGPLLFLFYIYNVTFAISDKCKCKLYADDLKLYSEITLVDDCDALQVITDKVKIWSDEWQLSMSVRKCAAICIGHRVNGLADHNYTMGTNSITLRDHVVDIGVTIDSTLRCI